MEKSWSNFSLAGHWYLHKSHFESHFFGDTLNYSVQKEIFWASGRQWGIYTEKWGRVGSRSVREEQSVRGGSGLRGSTSQTRPACHSRKFFLPTLLKENNAMPVFPASGSPSRLILGGSSYIWVEHSYADFFWYTVWQNRRLVQMTPSEKQKSLSWATNQYFGSTISICILSKYLWCSTWWLLQKIRYSSPLCVTESEGLNIESDFPPA